jgi:hypothetical protein
MTQLLEPSLPEQTVWVPPVSASPQDEVSQVVLVFQPPPLPMQCSPDEHLGSLTGFAGILAAAIPAWATIRSAANAEVRFFMVPLAFEGPCGPVDARRIGLRARGRSEEFTPGDPNPPVA